MKDTDFGIAVLEKAEEWRTRAQAAEGRVKQLEAKCAAIRGCWGEEVELREAAEARVKELEATAQRLYSAHERVVDAAEAYDRGFADAEHQLASRAEAAEARVEELSGRLATNRITANAEDCAWACEDASAIATKVLGMDDE